MMHRLWHFPRHNHYNTRSNKTRPVRTPGGRLLGHHVKKKGTRARCGDCRAILPGLPATRPYERRRLKKKDRTIARAYGGSRCHKCVRERIMRAFLVEEQKRVKEVMLEKEKQKKDEMKAEAKKKSKSRK